MANWGAQARVPVPRLPRVPVPPLHSQGTPCYFFRVVDYRRNLPHWFPKEEALFITWRLYGSMPTGPSSQAGMRRVISAGGEFRRADAALDRADSGPTWLKNPRIAACVVEKLHKGASELHHYELHAYVVMANHVHVLLTPRIEVRRLMRGLKGATARIANIILHRTGKPFWQDESFDHWVRNEAQFERIRNYIERNPVTAGLVAKPEDWPWSSAHPGSRP
jgi:putative transposase